MFPTPSLLLEPQLCLLDLFGSVDPELAVGLPPEPARLVRVDFTRWTPLPGFRFTTAGHSSFSLLFCAEAVSCLRFPTRISTGQPRLRFQGSNLAFQFHNYGAVGSQGARYTNEGLSDVRETACWNSSAAERGSHRHMRCTSIGDGDFTDILTPYTTHKRKGARPSVYACIRVRLLSNVNGSRRQKHQIK